MATTAKIKPVIIKSMSRKAPTFRQLAAYIDDGANSAPGQAFAHNLYHESPDSARVADQFFQNYQHLPKRANGNALLHEVLVLEPQRHLTTNQQISALQTLARRYCETRAPHQLAWGKVHLDTDYPHIHLMISSNAVRSDRRERLTKAEFAKLQRELEAFKASELPELQDRAVYREPKTKETTKIKTVEGEMIRRTGAPSTKQVAKAKLLDAFNSSTGKQSLLANLEAAGFELYQRGKTTGVVDQATGRKYRLSTLGLTKAFEEAQREKRPPVVKPQEAPQPQSQQPSAHSEDRAARLARDRAEAREAMERAAREELADFDPGSLEPNLDDLER